jgi:hypothetical protein
MAELISEMEQIDPSQLTPREPVTIDGALRAERMSIADVLPLLRAARWDWHRMRDEIQAPGWLQRLRDDGDNFQGPDRVRIALQGGPVALATSTDDELIGKVTGPALKAFARSFAFDQGALILGETGVGKTVAAFMAARRYVLAQREMTHRGLPNVVWAKAVDIGNARAQHRLGLHEAPLIEAAKRARVLVIDDLGWEADPKVVLDILAHRYDQGVYTLVTSGRTYQQLTDDAGGYGKPAIRRILNVNGRSGVLLNVKGK